MTTKHVWPLLAVSLLLGGCSTTITNLTPRQQPRNANGVYPFEVAWTTKQATIRPESIQPYVLVGLESYPMKPSPRLVGRWETAVPIAGTNEFVNYRFKFDYEYNAIPARQKGSKLSAPYQLQVLPK